MILLEGFCSGSALLGLLISLQLLFFSFFLLLRLSCIVYIFGWFSAKLAKTKNKNKPECIIEKFGASSFLQRVLISRAWIPFCFF